MICITQVEGYGIERNENFEKDLRLYADFELQ